MCIFEHLESGLIIFLRVGCTHGGSHKWEYEKTHRWRRRARWRRRLFWNYSWQWEKAVTAWDANAYRLRKIGTVLFVTIWVNDLTKCTHCTMRTRKSYSSHPYIAPSGMVVMCLSECITCFSLLQDQQMADRNRSRTLYRARKEYIAMSIACQTRLYFTSTNWWKMWQDRSTCSTRHEHCAGIPLYVNAGTILYNRCYSLFAVMALRTRSLELKRRPTTAGGECMISYQCVYLLLQWLTINMWFLHVALHRESVSKKVDSIRARKPFVMEPYEWLPIPCVLAAVVYSCFIFAVWFISEKYTDFL